MILKIQNFLNKNIVVFGLLLLIGAGIFANALNAPFIWDDLALIADNEQVKSFDHVKEWFTTSTTSGNENVPESDLYRPVIKSIFASIYELFGPIPFTFRILNILLHIVNSFLVFTLFKKL